MVKRRGEHRSAGGGCAERSDRVVLSEVVKVGGRWRVGGREGGIWWASHVARQHPALERLALLDGGDKVAPRRRQLRRLRRPHARLEHAAQPPLERRGVQAAVDDAREALRVRGHPAQRRRVAQHVQTEGVVHPQRRGAVQADDAPTTATASAPTAAPTAAVAIAAVAAVVVGVVGVWERSQSRLQQPRRRRVERAHARRKAQRQRHASLDTHRYRLQPPHGTGVDPSKPVAALGRRQPAASHVLWIEEEWPPPTHPERHQQRRLAWRGVQRQSERVAVSGDPPGAVRDTQQCRETPRGQRRLLLLVRRVRAARRGAGAASAAPAKTTAGRSEATAASAAAQRAAALALEVGDVVVVVVVVGQRVLVVLGLRNRRRRRLVVQPGQRQVAARRRRPPPPQQPPPRPQRQRRCDGRVGEQQQQRRGQQLQTQLALLLLAPPARALGVPGGDVGAQLGETSRALLMLWGEKQGDKQGEKHASVHTGENGEEGGA